MALPTFGQPLMGFDDPLGGRMIAGAPGDGLAGLMTH